MKGCEQAPGFSVYDHGLSVANHYRDLYNLLASQTAPGSYEWHLPDGVRAQLQELHERALTPKEARLYHVFHDCSKPSVLQVIDGKRHFPGHAEASARLYREAMPGDELTARLISKDMLCHTTKPAGADELVRDPDFPTLMLTAWAELHANASVLFGGFESDSFKIKRKRLYQLLKKFQTFDQLLYIDLQ